MKESRRWSIRQIRDAVKRRDVSVREIVQASLERIQETDERLKAFLTVDRPAALAQAEEIDRRLQNHELKLGFLTGIPIALKDNLVTRGVRTTCGSRILSDYVPPYSATVVRRLQADGAVLIGKTNLDEFAMGSSTENSAFFPTRNPWDPERVPGGSSGGSAAAVGALLVPGALGSDTGGSVRQPAAFWRCESASNRPTEGSPDTVWWPSAPLSIKSGRWPGRPAILRQSCKSFRAGIPGTPLRPPVPWTGT